MKTFSKIAVGAAAAVGLGFAAVAFSHGPGMGYGMGYGQGGGYGMGMHGPHGFGGYGMGMHGFGGYDTASLDVHFTSLKGELKITKGQTEAWEAFETAVRGQVATMAAMHASTQATMQTGQPDPDAHIALMQQRLAGMQAVQKARTDLYNTLTPEQKAVFDRTAPGPHGYRGPRG